MNPTVFELAKMVPMTEVAEYCGLEVTNHDMCHCPFHSDKHESMKIYDDHVYCFSCNTYADGVSLIKTLNHWSSLKEAATDICTHFGLISNTEETEKIQKEAIQKHLETKRRLNQNKIEELALEYMFKYRDILRKNSVKYAPLSIKDSFDDRYVYAVDKLPWIEYLLDIYFEECYDRESKEQAINKMIKNGSLTVIRKFVDNYKEEELI